MTCAPCCAKTRAICSPMPDPAPVTNAIFRSKLNMYSYLSAYIDTLIRLHIQRACTKASLPICVVLLSFANPYRSIGIGIGRDRCGMHRYAISRGGGRHIAAMLDDYWMHKM